MATVTKTSPSPTTMLAISDPFGRWRWHLRHRCHLCHRWDPLLRRLPSETSTATVSKMSSFPMPGTVVSASSSVSATARFVELRSTQSGDMASNSCQSEISTATGRQDLAFANNETVGVLPGFGDGTFDAAEFNDSGGFTPISAVAGDYDGDGRLDLAAVNRDSNNVGVLLNVSSTDLLSTYSPHGYSLDTQLGGYMGGELVQGSDNAFDGLNRLQVGGADYWPTATLSPMTGAAPS